MNTSNQTINISKVLPDLKATNRVQVIQQLASYSSKYILVSPNYLACRLIEQEKKETSGIGDGVAIFHLSSNKIAKPFTAFARLTHLVDFNSIDSQPVDMVFLLMSPAYDGPLHLRRLSRITRRFKNEKFRESLRGASDSELLYALWNDPEYLPQAA